MILTRMIIPNGTLPEKKLLYYRGRASVEDAFHFEMGMQVSFSTYFNAFFYGPYVKYTTVKNVCLRVVTSGSMRLMLMVADSQGHECLLEEKAVHGDVMTTFSPQNLADLPENGALFLKLSAERESGTLLDGWFETESEKADDVHLAAVICTYKREAYVKRNLEALRREIWGNDTCPIKEDIDVLVIDNGRTLQMEKTAHIHVFENRNYGGSGGFTRGLIEAYRRKDRFTHVLFMDDDISFEPEILLRTVQFLKALAPSAKPVCIGGQMLSEHEPMVQFESGACFENGRVKGNNRGLDLSDIRNLLLNMQEQKTDYNAWWYCCFPISVVDEFGLPMPFFIKGDDVEYGLRIEPKIVLTNGIGVWHMAFQEKYSAHLEYYIKRNELVVSTIHDRRMTAFSAVWKLARAYGKAVLVSDVRNIPFLLKAYRDFLKGPDFFLTTEEEKLNAALLAMKERPAPKRLWCLLTAPFQVLAVLIPFLHGYSAIQEQYIQRIPELTSMEFWTRHLGIAEEDNKDGVF